MPTKPRSVHRPRARKARSLFVATAAVSAFVLSGCSDEIATNPWVDMRADLAAPDANPNGDIGNPWFDLAPKD